MSDQFVELPAAVMGDAAFRRRREHFLAELERPAAHWQRPVAVGVLIAVALAVLTLAPISGASLAQRVVSGLGGWWSTPAPPPKDPAEVQSFAQDVPNVPPGITYRGGKPLPGVARDLLGGLGTAGDTITAFPTSTGAVCYMIQGAGTCANLEKWPWNTVGFTYSVFSTRDGGTRIFGVVADEVTSVSIESAGTEHPAILGNHAFYYHLPPSIHDADIQNVIATWKDGSVHAVPENTHWNPPHDGSGSPSGRPGPGSGASGGSPTTSSTAFLRGRVVRQLAAAQGIQDLRVLVSAGGSTNSSAVIVGRNPSGEECWTVVAALGEAGGAFRCGTSPGVEQGEPAEQRTFRVGCQTSGRAGSASADAGSCIGFVGPSVAKVEARLVDGSTSTLPVTEGAFAYAGSSRGTLPVSFSAYSAGGQEVGHQDIVLTSGLETNGG